MAKSSTLSLHQGRALMMVANKYPSLKLTLVEGLQNAIDAGATHVFIGINTVRRTVVVADDGRGVSQEAFDQALERVAETRKSRDQLGRFGIGVIAPLNKCDKFTFTSWWVGESTGPIEWTFEQAKILNRADAVSIPSKSLKVMPKFDDCFSQYVADFGSGVWRTVVSMQSITKDRVISTINLDELEEQFRTKLGHAMHKQGVTCRVVITDGERAEARDIVPQSYTGEPLKVFEYEDSDAGMVRFELYRAKRISGRRQGKVSVSENEPIYPLAWRDVVAQARGFGWTGMTDAFSVLDSGYFEGIITAKNISLAPERTKFEHGDALLGLYVAIDVWYQAEGLKVYETEREQQRDERYRQLSLGVMTSVRDLLRRPEFATLAEGLSAHIGTGRIGTGHGQDKEVVGIDDQPSTRVGQGGVGIKRQQSDDSVKGSKRSEPIGPTRDGDIPTGVIGRHGARRTLVKEDSLGLWLEITDFEFSTAVWDFDRRTGVLSFNSGSALWSELDGASLKRRSAKNDHMLEHLQKWVVLQVLNLLLLTDNQYEEAKVFVDGQLKQYATMFIHSS